MGMKKVSENDIARVLGLSRNTVSKALHGNEIVSQQTRQKIIKKAYEMGYAKLPKSAKAEIGESILTAGKRIAVISRREISSFWNRIVFGISDAIEKTDYSFLLCFISDEDEKNCVLPKDITNGAVQGIISLSVFSEAYSQKISETQIPTVFYDMPAKIPSNCIKADAVLVESYDSMYMLVRKLARKGRRKFVFVGNTGYCRTVYDRWRGFRDALSDEGIPFEEELCAIRQNPLWYYNYQEFQNYLEKIRGRVDTVVCANDDIALEAIRFFGGAIPKDVEIAGFDDKMNLAKGAMFSTVHVDNEYVGKRMFELVLERIQNPSKYYETVCIHTQIVEWDEQS